MFTEFWYGNGGIGEFWNSITLLESYYNNRNNKTLLHYWNSGTEFNYMNGIPL